MRYLIILATLVSVANFASANDSYSQVLKDGSYRTNSVDAGGNQLQEITLINDLPDHAVIAMSGLNNLDGTQASNMIFNSTGNYRYQHILYAGIAQAEDIQYCQPTSDNKTPCVPDFYDQNGKLLLQVGDSYQNNSIIQILNPKAFMIYVNVLLTRSGKTIVNKDYQNHAMIFSLDSN